MCVLDLYITLDFFEIKELILQLEFQEVILHWKDRESRGQCPDR